MSRRDVAELARKDQELALYRQAVSGLASQFAMLASGDLEPRIEPLPDLPELARLRDDVNRTLDLLDAFVRESGATLAAAAEGRFHRRFLATGMPGSLADSARRIDDARRGMAESTDMLATQTQSRMRMAEGAVEVSEHVAAASTELGASAQVLHTSAASGIDAAVQAMETVRHLETSAEEIQGAVGLIKKVAAQTRLLALNATIEAARAGEQGRGFAVVAGEVKSLADESTRFSDEIEQQVEASRAATELAVARISSVTDAVHEIHRQATGITDAASGDGGLSHLAETLHRDIADLTAS